MIVYVLSILLLFLLLVVTLFALLYSSGLFTTVSIERKQPPVMVKDATFAYKIHTGPYSEVGYLFTEAYAINSSCVQCGVRQLEDSPAAQKTEGEVERAAIGSILPRGTEDEHAEAFVRAGFKIAHLPQVSEALVASFPHVSFLSITIGTRRLYTCMKAYVKEHNFKVNTLLELYDGNFIHCIGLFEEDEKCFRKLMEPEIPQPEKPSPSAADIEVLSEPDPVTIVTHEDVETIPKPENMIAAMVEPTDHVTADGDNDSDSLDESFEKVTPDVPPE